MPRKKHAAFFMFLQEFKKNQPHESAVEGWANIDADQKAFYRVRAEEATTQGREAQLNLPSKNTVKKAAGKVDVDLFLVRVGARRVDVMAHHFVTCAVMPLYKRSLPDGSTDFIPMEVCLVRWSISNGCEQVYNVILNPGKVDSAQRVASYEEWPENAEETACSEISRIVAEIQMFVGPFKAVLTWKPRMTASCLAYLFAGQGAEPPQSLCQTTVLHSLLLNELKKPKKVPSVKTLASRFTRAELVGRNSITDVDTGLYCWHDSSVSCAGRRAVQDTYTILGELGSAFLSRSLPGRHFPKSGLLIPAVNHICKERLDAGDALSLLFADK